jgi:hypothetical protein
MSTKNQKPATTADILTNLSAEVLLTKEDPQIQQTAPPPEDLRPANPPIQKSNNPFHLRARCGKVARLPKEIRDQLNQMLLDGLPHAQIIQKLQEKFEPRNAENPVGPQANIIPISSSADKPATFVPSGSSAAQNQSPVTNHQSPTPNHETRDTENATSAPIENQKSKIEILLSLTPQHLTTWKRHGGYRDWLRDQQRIEACKIRHELTLELARSAEGLASYQAAPKVAVAQICQTIIDLGPEGLKDAMQASPLNCFRLLNALARLINSGLKCENQIQKNAVAASNEKLQGISRADLHQIEKDLNLL